MILFSRRLHRSQPPGEASITYIAILRLAPRVLHTKRQWWWGPPMRIPYLLGRSSPSHVSCLPFFISHLPKRGTRWACQTNSKMNVHLWLEEIQVSTYFSFFQPSLHTRELVIVLDITHHFINTQKHIACK
jgi:hypothetical protein